MTRSFHQVALVKVVRAHPDSHQFVHQLALDVYIVVHSSQQHGLVSKRDSSPRQPVAGLSELGADFVRVIYMDVQP